MKNKPTNDDPNIHECDYIRGKVLHVMVDRNNHWFCCRCNGKLTREQLADKWKPIFDKGKGRRK